MPLFYRPDAASGTIAECVRLKSILVAAESVIRPIFTNDSTSGARLLLLAAIALGLLFLDQQVPWVESARARLSGLAAPFYWVTTVPERVVDALGGSLSERRKLHSENQELKDKILILQAKLQSSATVRAENVHLRELLNSSELVKQSFRVAEVVGVAPDPNRHQIVINVGWNDGAYVGQPIIDQMGLVGQVVQVGPLTSWVLMLTDTSHALSVQVNRNGTRAIAEGGGRIDQLELSHVAATVDIKVGDLLVSSGLEGRFPAGYPVAHVTEVTIDPGKPFATVLARPLAQLDRSRHVLLVFTEAETTASLR